MDIEEANTLLEKEDKNDEGEDKTRSKRVKQAEERKEFHSEWRIFFYCKS